MVGKRIIKFFGWMIKNVWQPLHEIYHHRYVPYSFFHNTSTSYTLEDRVRSSIPTDISVFRQYIIFRVFVNNLNIKNERLKNHTSDRYIIQIGCGWHIYYLKSLLLLYKNTMKGKFYITHACEIVILCKMGRKFQVD